MTYYFTSRGIQAALGLAGSGAIRAHPAVLLPSLAWFSGLHPDGCGRFHSSSVR